MAVDAGQDGDVVELVEGLMGRPVPLVPVLGGHVADDFPRVFIPKFLPERTKSLVFIVILYS